MIKKRKKLMAEEMPEFDAGIANMPEDSKIFVDKSLEIADYIFHLMEMKGMKQKDLAEKMGKSEAEVSKLLAGMHNYTLRSISKMEAALGLTIICTPKTAKHYFPSITLMKSGYVVLSKKPESNILGVKYGAKVIAMNNKSNKQEEALAI
jgi:transcriptional regulator with XRE-family HTH domain